MGRPVRRAIQAAAFLVLVAAGAGRVQAETVVTFQYEGRGGPDFAGLIATGTGTFSFADGLATVGLSDLTTFAFTLDETTPNTSTFGLADLSSFSASMGPGPTMAALALATGAVQGTNPSTERREFDVASLDPAGSSSSYVFLGLSFQQTSGTVTITSVTVAVPEPSSAALAGAGALALIVAGGFWSRGRAVRVAV